MEYVKAAETTELATGEKKRISLNNKQILLVNLEGTYYAMDDACPHMGTSLCDGELEGDHIICPKHGSVFNVKTGKVVQRGNIQLKYSGVEIMKVRVDALHIFPIKVIGIEIFVGIE